MPQENKYPNDEFTMKESVGLNLLIGIAFLGCFLLMVINVAADTNIKSKNGLYLISLMFLLPAIGFVVKTFYRQNVITINKNGFYHFGELKTSWKNFVSAEVEERQKTGRYTHYYFVFIIRFNKPGEGYFELTVRLRDTYNKSGEEIIEAIKYFRPLPPLTSELLN